MKDYLYDGTFEGLLTCIYHNYYTEKASGIFDVKSYQPSMLNGFDEIATEEDKAMRVYDAIDKKISPYALRRIYRVFLSNDEGKETKILKYVVLGFKVGRSISSLHGNTVVFDVQAIDKKIWAERERMLQFVRFSGMKGGMLYAPIEPDNDVLELIAEHFCDRLKNEPFIIHDVKRDKAIFAYHRQWYVASFNRNEVPEESSEEIIYKKLWKNYFDNIAIMERKNPRCQKNFMPVRYWKHLTECTTQ
ncbi:MAG: DNA metabolism protein [Clostridiales bacterium]|nr:DNA metabolism protein [Clostridiales bacterium]